MEKLLMAAITALAVSLIPLPSEPAPSSIVEVQAHSGIDSELVDYVQEQVSALPDVYEEAFIRLGWSYYVVDWDIATQVFNGMYSSVAGVTLTAPKEIYIEDRWSAVTIAPVHEFGHFVDYMYSDTNCRHVQEDFMSIYREEAQNSGFYDTPMEWFAELFCKVYVSPDEAKQRCPRGYNYIKNLEDTL